MPELKWKINEVADGRIHKHQIYQKMTLLLIPQAPFPNLTLSFRSENQSSDFDWFLINLQTRQNCGSRAYFISFVRFCAESQAFWEEEQYLLLFSGSTRYVIVKRVLNLFERSQRDCFNCKLVSIDM